MKGNSLTILVPEITLVFISCFSHKNEPFDESKQAVLKSMRESPIGAEYFALYSDFPYDFNFGDPSSQNYSGNYRLSSDTTSFDLEEGAFIRGQYVILKHNSILFYNTLRSEEKNGYQQLLKCTWTA